MVKHRKTLVFSGIAVLFSCSLVLYEKETWFDMHNEKSTKKKELIMTLSAELPVLRARLGVSQEVMAESVGISRQTYSGIETGARQMSWTIFMALIGVLDMNEATSVMLDQIPDFIQEIRSLTQRDYC